MEILVQAKRKGIQVIESPVRVNYNPNGERISHFRPFVDFLRNSSTFTRLIFTRIFPPENNYAITVVDASSERRRAKVSL